MQRDLEGATNFEEVDVTFLITLDDHFGDEAFTALVDDFLVPAGLDERDALAWMTLLLLSIAVGCMFWFLFV